MVVAAWEGDIDKNKAHRVLNGEVGVLLADGTKDYESDVKPEGPWPIGATLHKEIKGDL